MTEPIQMSFSMWTRVGPRKHVLDGGVHLRYMANMIELLCEAAMRPFCPITLTACYYCNMVV